MELADHAVSTLTATGSVSGQRTSHFLCIFTGDNRQCETSKLIYFTLYGSSGVEISPPAPATPPTFAAVPVLTPKFLAQVFYTDGAQ
jgi:hypothetical protein